MLTATETDTEIISLYDRETGRLLGVVQVRVSEVSDPEYGPMACLGGCMWHPYRPKMSAGGVSGAAHVGPLAAKVAGF